MTTSSPADIRETPAGEDDVIQLRVRVPRRYAQRLDTLRVLGHGNQRDVVMRALDQYFESILAKKESP